MTTQPLVFLGHGNPMNTLDHNHYTEAWRALGAAIVATERPRAVVCVSAHWYINATAVTAMARPRVIHDFYGFPDELFAFDYPAPGAPEVAQEVVDTASPQWVGLDHDSWGLDHGTWSVLAHMFPAADVPVVQLSINGLQPPEYHLDLGRRLAPLRERGILLVGSGNVVHNLGALDFQRPDTGYDWAQRFDEAVRDVMTTAPAKVAATLDHPDAHRAVPTPDHFLPLLYIAGAAAETGDLANVLVDGYAAGSLSMTSYTVGIDGPAAGAGDDPGPLPGPEDVPPDESNM